jgi:hypothetical protein
VTLLAVGVFAHLHQREGKVLVLSAELVAIQSLLATSPGGLPIDAATHTKPFQFPRRRLPPGIADMDLPPGRKRRGVLLVFK